MARRIGEVINQRKSMKLTPQLLPRSRLPERTGRSKDNAREIYAAAEGHVPVGVLSKKLSDVASAVADMREYAALIDTRSPSTGAGDPNQSACERNLASGTAAA